MLGLARSGVGCANLLHAAGARVRVSDCADTEATAANRRKLVSPDIAVEVGGHTPAFVQGSDLVVVSPGIPDSAPPLQWARDAGILTVSEIEAAWQLCPATVIAVTGSTGKTTVTTLIGLCLEASGKKTFTCGNIGTPFSGEVPRMSPEDFVALEVSSFQLERIRGFRPYIAVMLNLNRNHLDRHQDMQEYLDAKKRIFLNQQRSDHLLVNRHDAALCAAAAQAASHVAYFEPHGRYNPNQAAVLEVCRILGVGEDVCDRVFEGFQGLEHRNELVAEVAGVRFVNDSKATVAESTTWALQRAPGKVVLICGGKHKGVEYASIIPAAKERVKEVVVIGEAAPLIRDALQRSFPVTPASTLEEAVHAAFRRASPGDTVLLSPMCSSFDMFSNYEHRGKAFKEIVQRMAQHPPAGETA